MMKSKSLSFVQVALAAFFFACAPAAAQWQVQENAVPVGRGGTTQGFKSVPLPSGSIMVGQAGIPLAVIPTGDVTFNTLGVTAIGANKVLDTMLRQSGALSLVGRSANSAGNVADIQAVAGSSCAFRETGNTIACGTLATAAYAANSVTNAKLAQMGNATIKGRTTAGTGDPEDLTTSQTRSLLSLVVGTNVQAWDADLDCIASISTNGLIVRTGAGTCAIRTVTAPAAGITVANGDGVSGNLTLALANDLAAVEGLSGTGIARRTGTDAWSVGTAVANSELATMATATFKGNVSGSTATPSDLTATQVTAALNNMVGDTGSGGSKGLVPAPGNGDGAAGKFLRADATWATPSGGGGGLSDTDRQNILLETIYQSKLFGGYRRLINRFADGYKASDGVNAGSSSNYSVNTASGYVAATGSYDANTMLMLHADGVNGGTSLIDNAPSPNVVTVNSGTTSTAQVKFGATSFAPGNASIPNAAWMSPAGDWTLDFWMYWTSVAGNQFLFSHFSAPTGFYIANTASGGANLRLVTNSGGSAVQTSGTVPTNQWVHIAFVSSGGVISVYINGVKDANTLSASLQAVTRSFYINGLDSTGAGGFSGYLDEVRWSSSARWTSNFTPPTAAYPATPDNATLVTAPQTSDATVSSGRVLLEYDPLVSVTLNTDITAEVSCNGGTNWATATLSSVTGYSGGSAQRKVAETAATACAVSGTSFMARIKTLNNKSINIYGTSLTAS